MTDRIGMSALTVAIGGNADSICSPGAFQPMTRSRPPLTTSNGRHHGIAVWYVLSLFQRCQFFEGSPVGERDEAFLHLHDAATLP
jgi:hypothetical protein